MWVLMMYKVTEKFAMANLALPYQVQERVGLQSIFVLRENKIPIKFLHEQIFHSATCMFYL